MILLDTNVVSEPLKAAGDANVLAWVDAQSLATLCFSTISLAELRFGIAALPASFEQRVLPLFAGRVLAFDERASQSYATLRARGRAAGQALAPADGYIAAVAATHGFAVATRDVAPFAAAGVAVINPWSWQGH